MATNTFCSWADMEDENEVTQADTCSTFKPTAVKPTAVKLSYALIASKGVNVFETNVCVVTFSDPSHLSPPSEVDDFTLVSKKKAKRGEERHDKKV